MTPPWIFLVRFTIQLRKNCQQNQNAITLISMIKSCMSNCRFNYSRKQPLNEMQIDSSCNQIFLYITSDWHLSIYSNLLQYYFEQKYLSTTIMNILECHIISYIVSKYHGLEDYSIVLQISVFELDNYIAVFCKNNFLFVCYIADSMWILRKLFCWFEVSINAKTQLESFPNKFLVYKLCQIRLKIDWSLRIFI